MLEITIKALGAFPGEVSREAGVLELQIVDPQDVAGKNHISEKVLVPLDLLPWNPVRIAFDEDLRWYIESYAVQDPFSGERAQSVTNRLQAYGAALVGIISSATVFQNGTILLQNQEVIIRIDDADRYSLFLQKLRWELLEDSSVWEENRRPKGVSVVRIAGQLIEKTERHASSDQQRILVLTARPDVGQDIPHRLITRSIFDIINDLQKNTANSPTVEIIRPGTFDALRETLECQEWGYYNTIHLDVHGQLTGDQAELVFIKKERGVIRRDPRPATQVATLLANHGTRHVILNACRSAMDSASTSNFARLLIEKGVSVAIGMSFNILDSAAKIFVRTLYSEYLGNRRSLPESVRIARKALQRNPRRRTRYATEVNIQDHITPVIFCSREMDMPYVLDHNVHDEDHPENIDEELIGREASMLDLENIFLLDEDDNIISLHGPPGVGKSAFLHHLSCWWEITGLIRRSILVDVSKHTDWSQVLEHVCQHFNLPYEPSLVGLHKYLEKHRCLLVFDNAGAIECSSGSDRNESAFRKFLLRVENSLVVISSRSDLHAFRDISQVYRLTNLDLRSGIQLMHKILHQNGRETNTGDSQEFIFLEFCVSLVSSHPLAIEIIARDFTRLDIGFQEYYQRLTDGAAISIDSDWVDSNPGARIISEAEAVIQGSNTINPEDLEMADIRLLSPFWHVIPCDFAPYLQFFRWAYERVSSDRWPLDEVSGGLEQWSRLQAQKRNKSRANYMNNREKHVFGFYQPVQDFEPEVWNLQEQYIPYFKRFKSIRLYGDILKGPMQHPPESGPRMFHTVHPIFTLVLRQAKFKLPPWLDHALYVSFNRFYSRRRQHMNDKSGDGLAKEAAIQLIRFEYVNFITYANFTLRLQPTYINFGQFHPNAVVHGISVSPKCHFIYRDVLSRAIETVRAEVTTETTMMSTLRSSLIKGYNTLFGKDLADLWLETKSMHAYFCIASINACIRDGVRVGLPMTDIPLLIDKIESTWRPGSFVPNDNMLQFLQYAKQCLRYVREPNSQDALKQLIDLTKYPVIIHIGSPMIALHDVVLPIYPDGLDLFTPYIQSAISSNRNLVDTFMWAHVLARTASTPLEIAEANRYLQLALEREIHGTNGPLIKVAIFRLMGNLAVKKHEFDLAVQLEAQALAFDVRKDALPHLTPLRIYSDRCAKIEEARRKRNPSYQQPRSITFRGTDSQSVVEPVMQSTAPGTWSTFPRRYAAGVGLSLAFPQARLCGTDSHIDQSNLCDLD